MTDAGRGYAFPHADADESRRLQLLELRLDPTTIRRIERLQLAPGARCLEVGGGRGSIARWLCSHVGPRGHVTATDLDTSWLAELSLLNLRVLRHDCVPTTSQAFGRPDPRARCPHAPGEPHGDSDLDIRIRPRLNSDGFTHWVKVLNS